MCFDYEQETEYNFSHNFRMKQPMSAAHIIFIASAIYVLDCLLSQWL
jgi:hypothetical protein